tara:strand:+ start:137 stop:670 length:534 start_codon:yes stop_codon:yes gene_type:complete
MTTTEKAIYMGPNANFEAQDINDFKNKLINNKQLRGRICTHSDVNNSLHEMFIFNQKSKYVCPHKNHRKNKSFHVIEGLVDIVFFSDSGGIINIYHLGDYKSGNPFYLRLSEPGYHTLVTVSELLIIKETINGPYKPSDTVYASWAPDEQDEVNGKKYLRSLRRSILQYDKSKNELQ